jgi:hypothetical protein
MLADTLFLGTTEYRRHMMAELPSVVGWRAPHHTELGTANENGPQYPNVRRALNAPPVIFTPALQRLAYEVMLLKNPTITENQRDNVFAGGTAFCNRHDINGDDPKLMDGVICMGHFFQEPVNWVTERGVLYLVTTPGVHGIAVTKPLPTAQQVVDNRWCFLANTGQGASGAFNFAQGNGGPVWVIYAMREPLKYQADWFARWAGDSVPDPLRYGG